MRNIYLLFVTLFLVSSANAQRIAKVSSCSVKAVAAASGDRSAARTTAAGDTLTLKHIAPADSLTIYKLDSGGYVTGTNYWGDKAFAERYDFNDDTGRSMKVIGLVALFSGNITPASAKNITFTVWSEGAKQMISASRYFRGFPGAVLDTLTVPVTRLGIGATVDTPKQFFFATPTTDYLTSFFIGYSINYSYTSLGGDTLGLASTLNGDRSPAVDYSLSYNVSAFDTTLDTFFNVQNAVMQADGKWYDNYAQNDSIRNNLAIYPIVISGSTASVKGITHNALTLFGAYPNPVTEGANIRFALTRGADVVVRLMDMAGRTVGVVSEGKMSAGAHETYLDMSSMPAGDYIYIVNTSAGDGMGGKITKGN